MIVSLCTVSRNRAHHYKETILKNIQDNEANGNVEFLILDYNSDDDLEDWIKSNLMEHVESGLLSYYKTFEPQYFHRSHSRNMAFKLAKGNLICNVDADNFTGPSFVSYLRNEFSTANDIFVCAGGEYDMISCSDIGGRICIHTDSFKAVGGYDEEMSNYGSEDYDLIHRLEMAKLKKRIIRDDTYLTAIKHDITGRVTEEFYYKNISSVLIHYINPTMSMLVYLFLDDTFSLATLVSHKIVPEGAAVFLSHSLYGRIALGEKGWIKGTVTVCGSEKWVLQAKEANVTYNLLYDTAMGHYRLINDTDDLDFYQMDDREKIEQAVLFYSEIHNIIKMKKNKSHQIINPNTMPIGAGIVYKNFNYDNPIVL